MTRRTRAAGVLASGLCAGMLLLAGCGNPEPAASSDAGQQGRDPALGGVQPLSSAPAGELLETAVANTDELMAALGGDWTFGDGAEAYDAERVREESVPEPCTARSEDSETVAGGLYSVVAETGSPEEDAGQTLERFEEALDAAGYQTAEGNGVGTSDRVTANGESEQGRVTLSRSADAVRIQLRTACSTDSSLQSMTG